MGKSQKSAKATSSNPPQEQPPTTTEKGNRRKTTSTRGVNTPAALTRKYGAPFEIRTVTEGERFLKIKDREIAIPFQIDWDSMRELGLEEDIKRYLDVLGLRYLAELPHEGYEELVWEFFTTLTQNEHYNLDLTFRLMNTECDLPMRKLKKDFQTVGKGLREPPSQFDWESAWFELSDLSGYRAKTSKVNDVKDPAMVVVLKWLGHTFGGRHEYSKVGEFELLMMNYILHPEVEAYRICTGVRLVMMLTEIPGDTTRIGFSWFIRALATYFRVLPSDCSNLKPIPPRVINTEHMERAGFASKGEVIPYFKRTLWIKAHGVDAARRAEFGDQAGVEPQEIPQPRPRQKEQVRRKGKEVAGSSEQVDEAPREDVPEWAQWEEVPPESFEEESRRFMMEQRRVWKETQYELKRLRHRQRREAEKLQQFMNAQGGPRYPSPTPSPDPPAFD